MRVFEILSCQPVSAILTIDLELLAVIFQVLRDSLVGLDLLVAAEAFDFKPLALVLDMLLKVFEVDALV